MEQQWQWPPRHAFQVEYLNYAFPDFQAENASRTTGFVGAIVENK
jgi:hypothetical protein